MANDFGALKGYNLSRLTMQDSRLQSVGLTDLLGAQRTKMQWDSRSMAADSLD